MNPEGPRAIAQGPSTPRRLDLSRKKDRDIPSRFGREFRELGGEAYAICASAFLADIVLGAMTATFPVYAQDSGLAPMTIGTLAAAAGFVQIGVAIPVGILSDRIGRKRLIVAGHAAFAVSMACLAFAGTFWPLLGGRLLFTLGSVAVFQIGNARLGDIVPPQLRHCAFGLLSATMGLGFGIGPLLGGLLSDVWGHTPTYLLAALLALSALFLVRCCLRGTTVPPNAAGVPRRLAQGFSEITHSPDLLLVTFANTMAGITFAGTLGTFLPLYGRALGISQTAVGTMFAVRSCVSALGRLPASFLARRLGNHAFLLFGLLFDAAAMFGIWIASSPGSILVLLAFEGLAYGGFLVAGQTLIANRTTDENRGTIGGIFAMASGLAGMLAPFALGVVAERWNIRSVFAASGAVLAAGFAVFAACLRFLRSRPPLGSTMGASARAGFGGAPRWQ